MSAVINREGAPQGASDPVLGLIATYRAHQKRFNAAPDDSAAGDAAMAKMDATVDAIARFIPTTREGLAASASLFAEMLEMEEIGCATTAKAWARLIACALSR